MLRHIFILTLFISSVLLPGMGEARVIEEHIYLVPAGDVDAKVLEYIKGRLPEALPMTLRVTIETRKELPPDAYYASRKGYDASAVLDGIWRLVTIDVRNERVLVVTGADLYTPEADHISGLADGKRGICIISLARLGDGSRGPGPDDKLFPERAFKEALYVIGRSLGLADCSDPKCVMSSSAGAPDTGKKKDRFCHDCRRSLRRNYDDPLFKSLSI
ncbi:MAG: archaemetzincin [Candidatus Omnitrophota bacterium]